MTRPSKYLLLGAAASNDKPGRTEYLSSTLFFCDERWYVDDPNAKDDEDVFDDLADEHVPQLIEAGFLELVLRDPGMAGAKPARTPMAWARLTARGRRAVARRNADVEYALVREIVRAAK